MVRVIGAFSALAVILALGARPAEADVYSKFFPTGNAEIDLPNPNAPGAKDNPRYNPNITVIQDTSYVAQASWLPGTSGWNIKDYRFLYDKDSDTLGVAVNFYGIAGDADGDGNPGRSDPRTIASGGIDMPNLGGNESITLVFDTDLDRRGDLVVGVPADKTQAGPGLIGFNAAYPKDASPGYPIQLNYGQAALLHLGILAYNPSADHPDFEFTITNFSKLPGLDTEKDFVFYLRAYAGSVDDVVAGENLFASRVPITVPREQVPVPEPATVLIWGCGLAGLALAGRRRARRGRPDA